MTNVIALRPKSIEQAIADAEAHGQRITQWQRDAMRAWAARNVKAPNTAENAGKNQSERTWIELGVLPSPCNCFHCGGGAVIFPPEDGSPAVGYCVCPCCSFDLCPHKPRKVSANGG